MLTEWLFSQLSPKPEEDELEKEKLEASKKKSQSNTTNTGSTASTPLAAAPARVESSSFLCFQDDCGAGAGWASDAAASVGGQSIWDEEEGGTPQHYRRINEPKALVRRKSQHRTASRIVPPKSITLYRPRRKWPNGTLQILWQQKERNAHGVTGLDKFQAHIELTMDDFSTIEITSEIASKYSNGTIEVHPDETTMQRIGSISCYLLRPFAVRSPIAPGTDCPATLLELLKQLSEQNLFESWRKDETRNPTEDYPQDATQDLYWRPQRLPSNSVVSYLWIEDIHVDERYRGVGLGLCLIEDACRRVADGLSWILVEPPKNAPSLQDYFCLTGFAPLEDSPFLARWNASPLNPRLEEVLPIVPFTTQQSRDQGFHL